MELEMAIGYLVALAVPLWLLVEQAVSWSWRRSSKQVRKQIEPGRLFGKQAPGPAAKAPRAPAMHLVHPRKTA